MSDTSIPSPPPKNAEDNNHSRPGSLEDSMPKRKRQRPTQSYRGRHGAAAAAAGAPRSTNIHDLIRARQKHGRVRFVSRVAAGMWSPDELQQTVGRDGHFLRKLKLSAVLKGHRGCVNTVSATPDGKYWITGSDDQKVKIWDCESHELKVDIASGHTHNVFQARALPYTDNEKIVTCGADGQVRLVTLSSSGSASTKKMGQHRRCAHRLAIEPGSPHRFMSCGEDGLVMSYDLRSHHRGTVLLTRNDCRINGMALNPLEPNYIFVCGDSPFLDLYDARKAESPAARFCPRELWSQPDAMITGCAVNWCGSEVVATYNPSGAIYRFDVKKHGKADPISIGRWAARSLGVHRPRLPRQDPFAFGATGHHTDGGPNGTEGRGQTEEKTEGGGQEEGRSHDGCSNRPGSSNQSGAAQRQRLVRERDASDNDDDGDDDEKGSGFYATKYTGHLNIRTVKQVTFYGPRSEYVASGSDCGHIFVWEKNRGSLEMLLWGDKIGAVNCLEPHPFLPTLATSGLSKTAKIWRPTRTVAVRVEKLFGRDGRRARQVVAENKAHIRRREQTRASYRHERLRWLGLRRLVSAMGPLTGSENRSGGGGGAAGAYGGGGAAGATGGEGAASTDGEGSGSNTPSPSPPSFSNSRTLQSMLQHMLSGGVFANARYATSSDNDHGDDNDGGSNEDGEDDDDNGDGDGDDEDEDEDHNDSEIDHDDSSSAERMMMEDSDESPLWILEDDTDSEDGGVHREVEDDHNSVVASSSNGDHSDREDDNNSAVASSSNSDRPDSGFGGGDGAAREAGQAGGVGSRTHQEREEEEEEEEEEEG